MLAVVIGVTFPLNSPVSVMVTVCTSPPIGGAVVIDCCWPVDGTGLPASDESDSSVPDAGAAGLEAAVGERPAAVAPTIGRLPRPAPGTTAAGLETRPV